MCQRTPAPQPQLIVVDDTSALLPEKRPLTPCTGSDSARSGLTEDETDCSGSEAEVEEEDIQLITRPRSCSRSRSGFVPAARARAFAHIVNAEEARTNESLCLTNFIALATRHDVLSLRDLLLRDDCKWTSVRFNDTAAVKGLRRWCYKKDNIHHHIQKLCLNKGIALEFHAQIELNVDKEDALSVLAEIQKHPEIKTINLVGQLDLQQTRLVLNRVTSLLRQQDRDWDAVNIHIGHTSATSRREDYQAWTDCMIEHMGIFSQLYTKYNIPIDIRPCAQ